MYIVYFGEFITEVKLSVLNKLIKDNFPGFSDSIRSFVFYAVHFDQLVAEVRYYQNAQQKTHSLWNGHEQAEENVILKISVEQSELEQIDDDEDARENVVEFCYF